MNPFLISFIVVLCFGILPLFIGFLWHKSETGEDRFSQEIFLGFALIFFAMFMALGIFNDWNAYSHNLEFEKVYDLKMFFMQGLMISVWIAVLSRFMVKNSMVPRVPAIFAFIALLLTILS